jgi:hypothetical protein
VPQFKGLQASAKILLEYRVCIHIATNRANSQMYIAYFPTTTHRTSLPHRTTHPPHYSRIILPRLGINKASPTPRGPRRTHRPLPLHPTTSGVPSKHSSHTKQNCSNRKTSQRRPREGHQVHANFSLLSRTPERIPALDDPGRHQCSG